MAEKAKKKELEVLNPELTGVNRTEKGETVSTTADGKPEKQTAEKEEDVLSLANKEKLEDAKKTGTIVTPKNPLAEETILENLIVKQKTGVELGPNDISDDANKIRLANERMSKANNALDNYINNVQPKINEQIAKKEQEGKFYQDQLRAIY